MTPDRYVRSPCALARRCPDRIVVHADDRLHELVGPSVDIWDLLVRPTSLDELLASLEERYEVVPVDEVTQTLRKMSDSGLVAPV